MIIRDNLTRFSADLEMLKMPNFDWTRTAMPSSLLLSPEGFIVIPTNSKRAVRRPHSYYMGFLHPWDMQDLLQSNQHLDLTYY